MECSQKPVWNSVNCTEADLSKIVIEKPEEKIRGKVLQNWDNIAKPLDGMGKFETLTAQIGAICGTDAIERLDASAKKAVIIMCADNGIVAEGISQSGQEVTLAVAKNMARRRSAVGRMAERIGVDTIPVDIGIDVEETIEGVLDRKIRHGTRNFRIEPAMTAGEAVQSIFTGIELVSDCKRQGYWMLATGEMGIGNTTTSSAVTAALLGCDAAEVTGRGAGLSDEKLMRKQRVIADAIERYNLRGADAFQVFRTVGGLDIGGLAGVCIGGALFHMPIVLDGVISMTAALVAERIVPGVKDYLLPSHKGREPAVKRLAGELGLEPIIDGAMALGEGTGAVMMLSLLDMALNIYRDGTTFSDICMEKYKRVEDGLNT